MSTFTEADSHMMEESGNGNQLKEKCQKVGMVRVALHLMDFYRTYGKY